MRTHWVVQTYRLTGRPGQKFWSDSESRAKWFHERAEADALITELVASWTAQGARVWREGDLAFVQPTPGGDDRLRVVAPFQHDHECGPATCKPEQWIALMKTYPRTLIPRLGLPDVLPDPATVAV